MASKHSQIPAAGEPVSITAFGLPFQMAWAMIFLFTIATEVAPMPATSPLRFYAYCGLKLALIFALGFFSPLAFWRFRALNHGILVAAGSAVIIEALQLFIKHGHSFHWYELLVKIVLVLLGFVAALDARYEQVISFGVFRVRLAARTNAHAAG